MEMVTRMNQTNVVSTNYKRVGWIDTFRGISMLLVIIGHMYGYNAIVGRFIYLFHVPAFFFLSGYLFKSNKSYSELLLSRVRMLLIPFFAFGLTVIFSDYILHSLSGRPYDLLWQIRCMMIQLRGEDNRIWFLPCLFLAEVFFYIVIKYKSGMVVLSIALIISWINALYLNIDIPWYPDTAVIGSSIMFIGYKAKKYEELLDKKKLIIIVCSVAIIVFVFLYNIYMNIYVDMVNNQYGNPIFFYSGVIAGCALLYYIAHIFDFRILRYIGKNTITFLCMNTICIRLSNSVLNKVIPSSFLIVYNVTRYFMTVLLLCALSHIINQYLPFYLGRKKTK